MADWIKATKKSPEPSHYILATIEDQSGAPMVTPCLVLEDGHIQIGEGPAASTYAFSVVKAWMPFPPPFEGRRRGGKK